MQAGLGKQQSVCQPCLANVVHRRIRPGKESNVLSQAATKEANVGLSAVVANNPVRQSAGSVDAPTELNPQTSIWSSSPRSKYCVRTCQWSARRPAKLCRDANINALTKRSLTASSLQEKQVKKSTSTQFADSFARESNRQQLSLRWQTMEEASKPDESGRLKLTLLVL